MSAVVEAVATLTRTCSIATNDSCANFAYKAACSMALAPCVAGALRLHSEFCDSTCDAALVCVVPSPLCLSILAGSVCKAGFRLPDSDPTCVPFLLPFADIVPFDAQSNVSAALAQRCVAPASAFVATTSDDVARCDALRRGVPTAISSPNATNKLLLYDDADVVILPTFATPAKLAADTGADFLVPALRVSIRDIQVSRETTTGETILFFVSSNRASHRVACRLLMRRIWFRMAKK